MYVSINNPIKGDGLKTFFLIKKTNPNPNLNPKPKKQKQKTKKQKNKKTEKPNTVL